MALVNKDTGEESTRMRIPAENGKAPYSYVAKLPELSLCGAVDTIPSNAFYGCVWLTDCFLPVGKIKRVDARAWGQAGISRIDLPQATIIELNAFDGCTKLKEAKLPKAETVGRAAFKNCDALTRVELNACEAIAKDAFENCTKLTALVLPATPPTVKDTNSMALSGDGLRMTLSDNLVLPATAVIYVPDAAVETYKATTVWKGHTIEPLSALEMQDGAQKQGSEEQSGAIGLLQ